MRGAVAWCAKNHVAANLLMMMILVATMIMRKLMNMCVWS